MLQKLLDEIQSGGTLEPGVLAARLGTTPQLVMSMLEGLERLGRLHAISACDSPGCAGCDLAGGCAPAAAAGRVWQLTP